jgi:hypothetical protein
MICLERYSVAVVFALMVTACLGCGRAQPSTRSAVASDTTSSHAPAAPDSAESPGDWPERDLPAFVFAHLDLTSFRNSTGPSRRTGQRLFAELGIHPTETSDSTASSLSDGWFYRIRVLERRDFNGDGVDEVAVCFWDEARNGGSYRVQQPLLLQLVAGRAIALDFEIGGEGEGASCPAVQ